MSKRQSRPRKAKVFVPEFGREVVVRGPTEAELGGTGKRRSTRDAMERAFKREVGSAVVSPKLTQAQIESLSASAGGTWDQGLR